MGHEKVFQLLISGRYWDDYQDRCPVDSPEQMAEEVARATKNMVVVKASTVQFRYLFGDAEFYAQGNTDDTAPQILAGARKLVTDYKFLERSL